MFDSREGEALRLEDPPRCTTCGGLYDEPYVNERAGERCADRCHEAHYFARSRGDRDWRAFCDRMARDFAELVGGGV